MTIALTTGAAGLPSIPVVVDNPLGTWQVQEVGLIPDGGTVWNVSFSIHDSTGEGCFQASGGPTVCGEYAFRVFREASPGGAAIVEFNGEHGDQLDNLDDVEELNDLCSETGSPVCGGAVDPLFGGFAANLCGGPDGPDEEGDAWLEVVAPRGTELYVGAVYETPENFDGDPPDEGDPCVQTDGDQTDFPGRYTGVSFSETIVLD